MIDPLYSINIISKYPMLKKLVALIVAIVLSYYIINNYSIKPNIYFNILDVLFGLGAGIFNFYFLIRISRLLKKISITQSGTKFKSIIKESLNTGPYVPAAVLTVLQIFIFSFMEEVIFRFIVLNYLIEKINILFAVLISSAVFSIYHFNKKILQLFLMGIFLCILVLLTGNLLTAIVAHITNNMMVFFVHNSTRKKESYK